MTTKIRSEQTQFADGWVSANETWTYASATTITVPAGATAKYQKGDKIKLTQTTVKYFYIVGVADTLLTITGGTSYTLANEAISANYYSKVENPQGFIHWFTFTPTVDGTGGSAGSFAITTNRSRFCIIGRTCFWNYGSFVTNKGSWSGNLRFTLPVTALESNQEIFGYVANQNSNWGTGTVFYGGMYTASTTVAYFHKAIGASDVGWSDLTARFDIWISGFYQIA